LKNSETLFDSINSGVTNIMSLFAGDDVINDLPIEGFMPELHKAVRSRDKDLITKLVNGTSNLEKLGPDGWTALSLAVPEGDIEIVQLLLDKGADIDAQDKKGLTPLHIAIEESSMELVALLVTQGANTAALTRSEKSPLHIAIESGRKEIINFIKDNNGEKRTTGSLKPNLESKE